MYHQKLSRDLLICGTGPHDFTGEQREQLQGVGVTLVDSALERVEGIPEGVRLYFADGTSAERVVLYTHGERKLNAALAETLGCKIESGGIVVTPNNQKTSVDGVFAAGDVNTGNQVAFAVAGGARAAMFAAFEILSENMPAWARA